MARLRGIYNGSASENRLFWLDFSVPLVKINDSYGPLFPRNLLSKPCKDCERCELLVAATYQFPCMGSTPVPEPPRWGWWGELSFGGVNASAVHILVNDGGQVATFFEVGYSSKNFD